jgi:arginine decarboxylase
MAPRRRSIPLIASLDIASAMMDEPTGPGASQRNHALRRRVPQGGGERRPSYEKKGDWFFTMFQPGQGAASAARSVDFHKGPDRNALQRCGLLDRCAAKDTWHGLPDDVVADDFAMLDPTKVTILCPGTDAQGKIAKRGVPGAILTKFLDQRRQAIARTGDYTVLILFSVGTTQGKSGTLMETLLSFKRLYDRNARWKTRCRNWSRRTRPATAE